MSDKIQAPSFNLSASNLGFASEEEFNKSLEGGRGFQVGNYDLELAAAALHVGKETGSIYCAKDPTWFNVKLTFKGTDDRTCMYWIQVPTTKLKFGEKGSMFQARKLVEFMAAIGKPVALADIGTAVPKWFADPSKLVGSKCNVDFDYRSARVERVGNGVQIFRKDGKPVLDENEKPMELPDFDSAKAYAEGQGLEVGYPEIVKFNPAPVAKKADADKW